ncbi:MAG: glycosyltransferase family 4 protein [Alistipes sp.]|nr:glycosyltransferase family 4 protein [Alistipes sp.]
MTRKILMLAPSSIPTYGAEAIVNKKLLTALDKSNKFEIDLISQRVKYLHYPIEQTDISLNSIHIIDNDLSVTPKLIWEHIKAYFLFGITFKAIHWAVKALPIAEELIANNNYDYILTKDAPSFVLGHYLQQKYRIKWVATWNDPYPGIKYPVPYGQGVDAKGNIFDRMIIKVMRKADIHIFPSERIRDYMLRYLDVKRDNTVVVPHVILETDITNRLDKSQLRILHSGTLQSPRSPKTFLQAFSRFKENFPDSSISVDILGIMEKEDVELINILKLQDDVHFLAPVTYSESLEILARYHIALIIEADCEEGIFLPTKVTDFMQYRKPIFAVSPKLGVLNDLYKEGYVNYFSDVRSVDDIYNSLVRIYNDFTNHRIDEKGKIADSVFSEKTIVNQYFNL